MAQETIATSRLFLDTSFVVAGSISTDRRHGRALLLRKMIKEQDVFLITTRAVLLEIGNVLAKLRFRQRTIEYLASLDADPMLEIVPVSGDLYARGFAL